MRHRKIQTALSEIVSRMRDRHPADARRIAIYAVRFVWETMLGRKPAPPPDLADRLPPDLIRFAAAKGCLGAVMAALDTWGLADRLQEEERRKARFTLARTALATAAMRRDLATILSGCGDKDIDVVLFKGHDLITTCYRQDTIRPVTDIDFLVRRDDYPRLAGVLSDTGYRRSGGERTATWFKGALIVDVHREFVEDARNPASAHLPRIPTDAIFDGSRRRKINGVPYRSPDPHHSLIMTALHALTHSYLMDFWFMDAGALLAGNNRRGFSDTLIDTARRYSLLSVLRYHLWAVKELFGYPSDVPVPDGYHPPLPIALLIKAAVERTDYLYFGDVLLGLGIDNYRNKLYYYKEMAFPHRDVIAREMDVDPGKTLAVYRARLVHLLRAGLRVLFAGRQ